MCLWPTSDLPSFTSVILDSSALIPHSVWLNLFNLAMSFWSLVSRRLVWNHLFYNSSKDLVCNTHFSATKLFNDFIFTLDLWTRSGGGVDCWCYVLQQVAQESIDSTVCFRSWHKSLLVVLCTSGRGRSPLPPENRTHSGLLVKSCCFSFYSIEMYSPQQDFSYEANAFSFSPCRVSVQNYVFFMIP